MIKLRDDFVIQDTSSLKPEKSTKEKDSDKNLAEQDFTVTDSNEVVMKKSRQVTVGRPIWEIMEMVRVYRENNTST